MPIADYAHWNEDAERIWWEEEGKHADEPQETWEDDCREMDALDAFYEEVDEMGDEEIRRHLADAEYCARWPKAVKVLRDVLADRGVSCG